MAAVIETAECFPRDVYLGSLLLASASEPNHPACSGGQTMSGLLGGWVCPCPCHRAERDSTLPRDDDREPANSVSSGGNETSPAHNIGTSGDDDATTYESGPNHEEHT